ncbi:hypothetical protein CRUP_002669 [Coryphaenoides rupestris]|nr:hypothetical protein CRUP_002669 [Coryphaenoides rupestris]
MQNTEFLCLKNIRTFLKVCHDKFGLRNSELFDPFDLFDVRDFGKVVEVVMGVFGVVVVVVDVGCRSTTVEASRSGLSLPWQALSPGCWPWPPRDPRGSGAVRVASTTISELSPAGRRSLETDKGGQGQRPGQIDGPREKPEGSRT